MTEEQATELEDDDAAAEGGAAAEETDASGEESTGLDDGDFVRLDYTARVADDDRVVDTTDPEIAEEEGLDEEDREFEPRVIVLGEGHLFAPVEEAIIGQAVGASGSVTIPAAEGFGEYDEEAVRTVSAERIDEDDRYPGAPVRVDGDQGYLETIVGGRARVDFNHPLAGEDLEYEYTVLELIEDRVERAEALLQASIGIDLDCRIETDEVEETVPVDADDKDESEGGADDEDSEPETTTELVDKETLYIEATPQLTMNQQWMFSKQQIATDLIDRLDLDRVIIQETIEGGPAMPGMMGGGMPGGDVDLDDVDTESVLDELDEDVDLDDVDLEE
jgi:FKBP-type peptidyl-prolyl cis-trans isomerase SlyD